MVLLFVVVLPMLAATAFLSYRYRQKLKKLWNGRPYKYEYVSLHCWWPYKVKARKTNLNVVNINILQLQ